MHFFIMNSERNTVERNSFYGLSLFTKNRMMDCSAKRVAWSRKDSVRDTGKNASVISIRDSLTGLDSDSL